MEADRMEQSINEALTVPYEPRSISRADVFAMLDEMWKTFVAMIEHATLTGDEVGLTYYRYKLDCLIALRPMIV